MTKSILPARLFAKRFLYIWFFAAGVAVLLLAGLLWWNRVQVDPERVFWGMLEQSLRTDGVTMQAVQGSDDEGVDYAVQYSLGADNRARSVTSVSQRGANVVTETIGTPEADYTRYTDIETDQTNSNGEPLDISEIEGVWAKSEGGNGGNQMLGQAVLGLNLPLGALPVPIGNVQPEARQKLLDQMRTEQTYKTSYKDAKKQHVDGRLQYVYDVEIQVILYAGLMKHFAKSVGLHEFDQLDPNTYSGAAPIEVQMTVDARSRHLVGVELQTPDGMYKQTYSSYDIPVRTSVPEQTIPAAELQQRLQELQ